MKTKSLLSCLLVFGGTPLFAAERPEPDPWQSWNRKVHAFNKSVDTWFSNRWRRATVRSPRSGPMMP